MTSLLPAGTPTSQTQRTAPWILKSIWNDVQTDDCLDLAAQMSFYFVLALFPFLIVVGSVVGWLPSTTAWSAMTQWLATYLPPQTQHTVLGALELTQKPSAFFSYGLLATIWVASSGFVSLMESLSLAYGFPDRRGFFKKRILAIAATIVGIAFVIVSFCLLTAGHSLAVYLSRFTTLPILWELMRWLATLGLMILGLDMVNYFLPNMRRPWRWLTPGVIFVSLTIILSSEGFNYYVRHFGNYPRFYGAMSAFVILVSWIYMASLILLVGAEIDSVTEKLQRGRITE